MTLNALQGALVRAYGAGVSLTQKTTNSSGVVKFRLKPTQLKKVTFRVSKLTLRDGLHRTPRVSPVGSSPRRR